MNEQDSSSKRPDNAAPGLKQPGAVDSEAQIALFVLPDGVTLEVHIPGAREVRSGPSAAREAGFILRRGREVVNVGPLGWLLRGQGVDAQGRLGSAGSCTHLSRRARRAAAIRPSRTAR